MSFKHFILFALSSIIFLSLTTSPHHHLYAHNIDLQLENLQVEAESGSYNFTVTVINPSRFTIPESEFSLSYSLNNDPAVSFPVSNLPPMSAHPFTSHPVFAEDNYYHLTVELHYEPDINPDNNLMETSFIVGTSPLVLNELLFKETPDNQEWVEIYNRSNQTIVMEQFYLIDAAEIIKLFNGIIPPQTYMVVCRNKQKLLDYYPFIDSRNVIESSSWAILNNDRETLLLADRFATMFDYTEYTAAASYPHNVSLERINPYDDKSLWGRSIHPNLATPTLPNSLLPLEYDVGISAAVSRKTDNDITHEITINNYGYQPLLSAVLLCYAYYDTQITGELIFEKTITLAGAETTVSFSSSLPLTDYTTYKYQISSAQDMDSSNNQAFSFINNNALPVVVNEVMFRTFTGEPKWVELFVNHRYKYLNKLSFHSQRDIISFDIPVADYLIITNSSADSLYLKQTYQLDDIPVYTGLRNLYVSGEELTITDPSHNIIERFVYDPDGSSERSVSLERINPLLPATADNWGPSIDALGCTPGKQNSLYTQFIPPQTTLNISPNPFSPLRGERTIISYEFPERLNRVTCRIFDLKGRLVNTLINQQLQVASGTIIWDGYRENGSRLPIGVYIVTIEAAGYDSEKIFNATATIVIAR